MDKSMTYYIAIVGFLIVAIGTAQFLNRPKRKAEKPFNWDTVVIDTTPKKSIPIHQGDIGEFVY